MGNKTVQTLLDLCTELKNKRERLQQQWQQAQYYLNDQHQHLNQEVSTLRTHCSELTREFDYLQSDLTQLHHLHKNGGGAARVPLTASESPRLTQLTQDMAHHYTTLQQEVEFLHADWGHLSGELLQLQALWQQQKTQDQTHILTENLALQATKLQAAEDNYHQLLSENQQQLAHIATLTAELQALQNETHSLKAEVSGVNADLSTLQQQLQSQHSSREQHLATIQSESQAQQATLAAELNEANTHLEQAHEQHAALDAELNDTRANLEHAHEQHAALAAELNEARANLEHAHEQHAALETELNEARANLEHAHEQHAALETELNDTRANLEQAHEQHAALETELNDTRANLEHAHEQHAALATELNDTRANLEHAHEQHAALATELNDTRANLEHAHEQHATRETDLNHDLEQKAQHVQELQAALAHQQTLTHAVYTQMADCQQQFVNMTEHTHLLQADLSALSAEIQLLPDLSANNHYLQAEMQKYQKGLQCLHDQLTMAQSAVQLPTQRLQDLEQQQTEARATQQQCEQRLCDTRSALQELAAKLPEVQGELTTKNELLDKFGSYANESFLTEVERLKGLLENYEHEMAQYQQLEQDILDTQQAQIQSQYLLDAEVMRAQGDLKLATDRVAQLQWYVQAFESAQADESSGVDALLQKQLQALETERQQHLTEIASLKSQLAATPPQVAPARPASTVSLADYNHLKAELEQLKTAIKETSQHVDENLTSFLDEIELPEDFVIEDLAPDAIAGSIFNEFEKLGDLLGQFREDHEIDEVLPLEEEMDAPPVPQQIQQEILLYVDHPPFMNEWDEQLETYLQDFHLKHHWIDRNQLDQLSTLPAKGLVCLLQATQSLPHEVAQELQASGIPYIKHYLSNLTRLKIDLYDAFVR